MYFKGYKRSNGTVGIRNKMLIISVDECLEGISRKIADEFEDVIIVTNYNTCMLGGNEETLSNLINIGCNPNVAGVLVMAMHFAAVGAQLILWTSGGAGFNNQLIPVIRVSGNENLINEDIDIDASKIMRNEDTVEDVGSRIFDKIIKVAGGEKTSIEDVGYSYCTLYQKDTRLEYCIKKCEL
ncbi:D-galactarate dehydratase / Altronate hydrolase, C terminus [Peptoclostridium litorale DSM 5388]|uniref:D-galactarate dehydratase/altronate hydrolase domain-containing protein n=1 Tax=Peptoclostridium litorale DSM 5388 TaxID=1121324 RepID=A0A069RH92_PEPLI|nr:UxaA family hydrolase [Peptoclostridium litorale]KDR96414.1 D-galactarate dehydratase/altronate hydrolase domain-containing protein [Peptoclostridium litorale DSM 5388]SIN70867.1 D-galactarate dehydratase / Altronate hydrolase, C terminus [Peptoclostridium litorale DSM 5388]